MHQTVCIEGFAEMVALVNVITHPDDAAYYFAQQHCRCVGRPAFSESLISPVALTEIDTLKILPPLPPQCKQAVLRQVNDQPWR